MKTLNLQACIIFSAAFAAAGWVGFGGKLSPFPKPPADLRDAVADASGAMKSLENLGSSAAAVPAVPEPAAGRISGVSIPHKVVKRYSSSPLPEGRVERDMKRSYVWNNPECGKDNNCEIRGSGFDEWDFRVTAQGDMVYGTGFSARYTANETATLEKYGFVQWIKGCVFSTALKDGKLTYEYDRVRPYWLADGVETTSPFYHPVLAIDSWDRNPLYGSSPGLAHPGGYKWNRVKGSVENATMVRYFDEKPPYPELYMTDFPATSSKGSQGSMQNVSLHFTTCLYKVADIPQVSGPETGVFPGALACFDWANSHIYNYATNAYEAWDRVHPACKKSLSEINPARESKMVNSEQ